MQALLWGKFVATAGFATLNCPLVRLVAPAAWTGPTWLLRKLRCTEFALSLPIKMAFKFLGPMHPVLFCITQVEPVWGDSGGGFIASLISLVRHPVARDSAAESKAMNGF